MENICLKVLAGFMAGESASHLSKVHSLPLEQTIDSAKVFFQSLGCKRLVALNNVSCGLFRYWVRKVKKFRSIDSAYLAIRIPYQTVGQILKLLLRLFMK